MKQMRMCLTPMSALFLELWGKLLILVALGTSRSWKKVFTVGCLLRALGVRGAGASAARNGESSCPNILLSSPVPLE